MRKSVVEDPEVPRVGRPPLPPEQIDARVAAYCERYGVVAADGLPPFPAGQRETAQHRAWLALYRARQRHAARSRVVPQESAAGACPLCGGPVAPEAADTYTRRGERRELLLHRPCAALARAAEAAGPDALTGIAGFFGRARVR